MCIKRFGNTHWGFHYALLLNIVAIFSSIMDVLEDIKKDGTEEDQKTQAHRLSKILESFDCIHMTMAILGITNELNFILQIKD